MVMFFFVKQEQNLQVSQIGIKSTIYDGIFPKCLNKSWSDGLSKTLSNSFVTDDNNNGDKGMAILDSAVVADDGVSLWWAAYTAEYCSSLILTTDEICSSL